MMYPCMHVLSLAKLYPNNTPGRAYRCVHGVPVFNSGVEWPWRSRDHSLLLYSYIVPFASNLFNLTVPFLDGRNRTFLPYYPAKSQSRQFYLISLFLIFISKVQKFSETCVMKNEGRQLVLSDMKFSRECHTETNALQGWGDTAAGSMLKRSGLAVLWM